MNIYKILKYNRLIKNFRIKSAGIFLLHTLGKRYLAVYFDPVLACNLRCQMCYFSDEEIRKTNSFRQGAVQRYFPQKIGLPV